MRSLGDIPSVDDSLQTGAAGSSFTATLEWSRRRPLRIDYLALPGLSARDPWRTVYDWDYVPGPPGQPALILFADALPAARPLRVWHQAAHAQLRAFDDPLADALAPELATAAGAEPRFALAERPPGRQRHAPGGAVATGAPGARAGPA